MSNQKSGNFKRYESMETREERIGFLKDKNLTYENCGFEVVDWTLWQRFIITNSKGTATMIKTVGHNFIMFERGYECKDEDDEEILDLQEELVAEIDKDQNFIDFYKNVVGEDVWYYELIENSDIYADVSFRLDTGLYTIDGNNKIIKIR